MDPKSFYKTATIDPNNKVVVFNRIYDLYRFNEVVAPSLTGQARSIYDGVQSGATSSASRINWFGTTNVADVIGTLDQYTFSNELNNFIQRTRSNTVNVDVRDISQKKKMTFTERDIGVFSFDLASLGLVPLYEYYSPLLNRVVDSFMVRGIRYPDGKMVYFHKNIIGIPQHEIFWSIKDGAYFSPMLNAQVKGQLVEVIDDKFYHKDIPSVPEHEVDQKQKIDSKGKKVFLSTWKKSFIYFPKIDKKIPRIDLIINAAYSGAVAANTQMIYGSMAGLAIAEKLQNSGVKFRIFASIGDALNNSNNMYRFIKLKDENEPLNANGLAIILSDGRYYRYQDFLNVCTTAYELGWGESVKNGISGPINNPALIKGMFVEYLKATKDFDSGQTIVENAKIVIPTVLSDQAATDLYNRTITDIQNIIP